MGKAAARFYRNNPCCGGAPVWISPTDPSLYVYSRPDVPSGFIDNLTPAEQDIADAIALVGTPPYPNPDALYPNLPHAALTKAYQRDQYLRSIVLDDMMNARTGPGTFNMRAVPVGDGTFKTQILFCPACGPDAMETFLDDLTGTFGIVEPFLRGVAMVISYVPVLGTAASFIISTALNLADGDSISDSVLTAIGQALPGQPASGMAYEAVRSAIDGDKVDVIVIKALPNPPMTDDIKKVIYITSQIIEAVANGEKITDAALDQLSAQLPQAAQDVMSAARNLANGMPLSDAALAALGRQAGDALENAANVAAAAGSDAINQFVSQAGLQAALDTLPTDIQLGVKAAWTAQTAKKQQEALAKGGFTTAESNKANNDVLAAKGRDIIHNYANVGNSLLSAIRNGKTYTRNLTVVDTMTGVPMQVIRTDTIDATWQRGFDIAIGLCQGLSKDGPDQQRVRASLTLMQAQKGFDMGQSIQFSRTAAQRFALMSLGAAVPISSSITSKLVTKDNPMNATKTLGRVQLIDGQPMGALPQADVAQLKVYAAQGALMAQASPIVAAARSMQSDGGFRWGFDIGSALAKGNSIDGPTQKRVRDSLSAVYSNSGPNGGQGSLAAITGFYAAQHLQFGFTKAGGDASIAAAATGVPATQAAGALMTAGAIGQGTTAVNSTVGLVSSNAVAKAGAAQVISAKQGFFAKLLAFFGF